MTPSTHYPTNAELAAFRRTFAPYPAYVVESTTVRGAWPHEREHGIGYREWRPALLNGRAAFLASRGRREANRLRHMAWNTLTDAATTAAIETFAPSAPI